MTILITGARILTLKGSQGARRGLELQNLGLIEEGWVRIDGDLITAVGEGECPPEAEEQIEGDVINAGGAVLMPSFVDCHTHACWAGDRFDEFEATISGRSYLEILEAGGGIMSTVRDVRAAPEEELVFGLIRRLTGMLGLGTGTVEVKSGYGLSTEAELKMLRSVHEASRIHPVGVVGTFLGAHAIDRDNPKFVDETINETLPAVTNEFPGITCDAYCEEGAWTVADTVRLLTAAREQGCPVRVHSDQFNSLGMVREAIQLGAVSVDHLEAVNEGDRRQLAESATFGVVLPGSAFHLDCDYAPARAFIEEGGALAVATNYNPGSSPTPSIPFAIALACRKLGLSPAEAITCTTWNPACVLGIQDTVGAIVPGYRANVQLLDCTDERDLAFEFATAGPLLVILRGMIVHSRAVEREGADEIDEFEIEEDD